MAASVVIAGAWDFAAHGTATFTVTDSGGAHAPLSFSSGYYDHGIAYNAGAYPPTLLPFSTALQTSLNALGARTYTVSFDATTGRYTITVDSGTFSIACNTAALRIIGSTVSPAASTLTAWTSDVIPYYVIVPAKPGLTRYIAPTKATDAVKSRVSSSGQTYRVGPTAIMRSMQWEHEFEPKERVDADYLAGVGGGTHLYTWEQLWSDYGLAKLPIGIQIGYAGSSLTEYMGFSLAQSTYDASVYRRRAPSDDVRFTIMVKANLWTTTTSNAFARFFDS